MEDEPDPSNSFAADAIDQEQPGMDQETENPEPSFGNPPDLEKDNEKDDMTSVKAEESIKQGEGAVDPDSLAVEKPPEEVRETDKDPHQKKAQDIEVEDASFLAGPDLVLEEEANEDIVQKNDKKDVVQNDVVQKDVVQKDVVQKEVVQKEVVQEEVAHDAISESLDELETETIPLETDQEQSSVGAEKAGMAEDVTEPKSGVEILSNQAASEVNQNPANWDTSDRHHQEDVVQEDVVQEEVVLEDVVQEDVVQEDVVQEDVVQEDVVLDDVGLDEVVQEEVEEDVVQEAIQESLDEMETETTPIETDQELPNADPEKAGMEEDVTGSKSGDENSSNQAASEVDKNPATGSSSSNKSKGKKPSWIDRRQAAIQVIRYNPNLIPLGTPIQKVKRSNPFAKEDPVTPNMLLETPRPKPLILSKRPDKPLPYTLVVQKKPPPVPSGYIRKTPIVYSVSGADAAIKKAAKIFPTDPFGPPRSPSPEPEPSPGPEPQRGRKRQRSPDPDDEDLLPSFRVFNHHVNHPCLVNPPKGHWQCGLFPINPVDPALGVIYDSFSLKKPKRKKKMVDAGSQAEVDEYLVNLAVAERLKELEESVAAKKEMLRKLCERNAALKADMAAKDTVVFSPAMFCEDQDAKDLIGRIPLEGIDDFIAQENKESVPEPPNSLLKPKP